MVPAVVTGLEPTVRAAAYDPLEDTPTEVTEPPVKIGVTRPVSSMMNKSFARFTPNPVLPVGGVLTVVSSTLMTVIGA